MKIFGKRLMFVDEVKLHIPFKLCSELQSYLNHVENYMIGSSYLEKDSIQHEEDLYLYKESIRLKEQITELSNENTKLALLLSEIANSSQGLHNPQDRIYRAKCLLKSFKK